MDDFYIDIGELIRESLRESWDIIEKADVTLKTVRLPLYDEARRVKEMTLMKLDRNGIALLSNSFQPLVALKSPFDHHDDRIMIRSYKRGAGYFFFLEDSSGRAAHHERPDDVVNHFNVLIERSKRAQCRNHAIIVKRYAPIMNIPNELEHQIVTFMTPREFTPDNFVYARGLIRRRPEQNSTWKT